MEYWWAYIHSEQKHLIRVKHLLVSTQPSFINDLDAAKEERDSGNDFIYILIAEPIEADNKFEAHMLAEKWLVEHGFSHDPREGWIRKRSRFVNLDLT